MAKNPGGRPTKYKESVIPAVGEYLKGCSRETATLPTIEGLAIYLGVNSDTIYEWEKKHKRFSVTIKELMERQRQQLVQDGFYGGKEVNASMGVFLLKVNHHMVETDRHEFPGPITVSFQNKEQ